jgi:putative SOS response-associated peptidase YedK
MCNRYGYNSPHHRLVELFGELNMTFRWPEAAPNLAPLEEIRPTDPAPVIRPFEDGVRLDQLRWGFPPTGASRARNRLVGAGEGA